MNTAVIDALKLEGSLLRRRIGQVLARGQDGNM